MDVAKASTDAPLCPGCVQARERIAQLEGRIVQLEARLEELSRSGKRQSAPFSRAAPKLNPKRPGRKRGEDYGTKTFRAVPPVIDEVHEAPLPERCPRCGGRVIEWRVAHQYQVEIPRRPVHRQFNVHIGCRAGCDCRLQGRHPLQTSDALGCCASQIGPEAQAAAVMLNKELGLSQGKISRFFAMFFGIMLTRGGSCQIMPRAGERCRENDQAIVKQVRQSRWIVPDETGWRIGGRGAWLHAAVSENAVAYLIARQRGFEASRHLIGEDYAGTLIHDDYASYDRFRRAIHQTCLGHLLRRCHELLETARGGAVIFPRRVKAILQEALAIRDLRESRKLSLAAARSRADGLQERMMKWTGPLKTHPPNERLAARLHRHAGQLFTFLRFRNFDGIARVGWAQHAGQLFTFLRFRGIDATNHRAEQAIRPAVVNRKVWSGNRTEAGAMAQSILMSVLFTATKLHRDGLQFLSQALSAPRGQRPLLIPGGR